MRIIPINSVKKGTVLANNIFSENGDILLKKGVILTEHLIERVIENGIITVYIDDGYTDHEVLDVIQPEIRIKAMKAIKETFKQIENYNQQLENQVDGFNKKIQMKSMEKYVGKLKSITQFIVDDISNSHQLMINLVDIKNLNNYLYEHALSVAILSTVVGIELRLTKHQLYNLFLGAMVHDIGKLFIDKSLISQKEPYSLQQQEAYDQHTKIGYEYLKENYNFEAPARIISLQHHECFDGTGYPKGMEGDSIHLFSRIVAVCNTYDEMVSDTPQAVGIPVNEAIEFLMGNAGACFDFKVVEVFTRKVNPYPIGTLVELSNNEVYLVTANHANFPMRPTVQKVNTRTKSLLNEIIDLMEVKDLVIQKIVY
jgi:HD-GYP domain-containing protein (c-di-GMP phosphodiesterase class II)